MLVYQRKGDTLVKLNLGDGISYEQIVSLENAVKAAASAAQAAKESADSKLPLAGGTLTGSLSIPTPDTNAPLGAAINREAADRDYVKKSGGELTGSLNFKYNIDSLAIPDTVSFYRIGFWDKNGLSIGDAGTLISADGSHIACLDAVHIINSKTVISSLMAYVDNDGTKYATCPPPQENSYANHIDTLQASINRHPVRLEVLGSDYKIFVGGANASNSKDLWQGRGTSPEMPFASLISVANYIRHISGQGINLTINIQDDLYDEPSCTFNDSMFGQITIQSVDSNIRTIHGNNTKYAFRYGKAEFNNINFSSCYFGSAELGILLVDKNVGLSDINIPSLPLFEATTGGAVHFMPNLVMTVSGTSASFISANAYGNASLNPLASITGNITGKKYNCAAFGRIFSGGKGATAASY